MIPVEVLLYKIDQQLNKLSSNEHQQIPLEDKLLWLNQAQNATVLSRFDTDGTRRLGFDAFLKQYHDIETLIVPWKELSLTAGDAKLHSFRGDLSKLDPRFLFYVECYILADKGHCEGHILHTERLTKHGDLTRLLRNDHYKPSFEYQDTLVQVSAQHLETYSDGTFTPKTAHVSYVRYPLEIDLDGYEKLDGSPSARQDCELPDYLQDEIVSIAVNMIKAALALDRPTQPQ